MIKWLLTLKYNEVLTIVHIMSKLSINTDPVESFKSIKIILDANISLELRMKKVTE